LDLLRRDAAGSISVRRDAGASFGLGVLGFGFTAAGRRWVDQRAARRRRFFWFSTLDCTLQNLQVLLAVLRGKLVVSAASSAALRALRTSLDMTPSVVTGKSPDKQYFFSLGIALYQKIALTLSQLTR
jgi:hypothetical protein